MARSRKPRNVNRQLAYDNVGTSNKNGDDVSKSRKQKRKLSDMLGPQWSHEELQHFYRAYYKHGKDWTEIAAAVHGRSVEMVEALYTMNRAYLSLPRRHTSATGLVAMMTDHCNMLKDAVSEQEPNEPMVAPEKPQKHAQGSKELGESLMPDLLQSQSAVSNYGCLSPLKKKCSAVTQDRGKNNRVRDSTGRQAVRCSTPFSSMADMPCDIPSLATTPDMPLGPTTYTPHRLVHAKHQAVGSSSAYPLPTALDTPPTAPPHEPSTTTSSSIPNTGPAKDVTAYSESDIESNNRTKVTLHGDVMLPSRSCSQQIRKIFQKRLDIEGSRWKTVSQETKDFYFEEFKKYYYWDQAIDVFVKVAWEKKAAKRYSDLLNYVKSRESRPAFVSEAVWMQWQEFWNDPDTIRKSAQNSKNRQGRDDSAGPSCHTGGSISYAEHGRRLAEKLGRKPTSYEFFLYTHTRNHDGKTFVDERSRQVNDEILSLLQQVSQNSDSIDENQVYYKAVGGERKRRVYGLGSEASQYYRDDINSSLSIVDSKLEAYTTAIEQLEQRLANLQESLDQGIEERVRQQMATLEQTIEQRMAEVVRQKKLPQGRSRRHRPKI